MTYYAPMLELEHIAIELENRTTVLEQKIAEQGITGEVLIEMVVLGHDIDVLEKEAKEHAKKLGMVVK